MAQQKRRRLSPEARRAEILQAAKELFAEQGYEKTQLQQIAARIGASRSVFAPYFNGKEEIYDALFAQWEAENQTPIHFPLIEDSAVKTLRNVIEVMTRSTSEEFDQCYGRDPLMSAAIRSRTSHADQIMRVLYENDIVQNSLQPIMAYGQLTGELRSGDPMNLALLLFNLISGIMGYARAYHIKITDELIDQAVGLFLNPEKN